MPKNLIARIDRFFEVTVLEPIPTAEKIQQGMSLLNEAEAVYPTANASLKVILGQKIGFLRSRLRELGGAVVPTAEFKSAREKALYEAQAWLKYHPRPIPDSYVLGKTRKYLEDLKAVAVPPTPTEVRVIAGLTKLFNEVQAGVQAVGEKRPPQIVIAAEKNWPPILIKSWKWWKAMRQVSLSDEVELQEACHVARNLCGELKVEMVNLTYDESKVWGTYYAQLLESIAALYRKWQSQLQLKKQEENKLRATQFQYAKSSYGVAKYVGNVRKAEQAGVLQNMADIAANNLLAQMQSATNDMNILMNQAWMNQNPAVLNLQAGLSVVQNARKLAGGIIGKVPDLISRDIVTRLNTLEAKYYAMANLKKRLS